MDAGSKTKEVIGDILERLMPRVVRSEGVEEFNPERIVQSIKEETGLPNETCVRIVQIVVRRLISSGIRITTSPMIREMACAAMIELGLDEESICLSPPWAPLI